LGGANVEIRERVGAENFFRFGLTVEELAELRGRGYRPRDRHEADASLREVLDGLASGDWACGDAGLFEPLVRSLLEHDPFFVLADYGAYVASQEAVGQLYAEVDAWVRRSILNVAPRWVISRRIGRFGSTAGTFGRSSGCRSTWAGNRFTVRRGRPQGPPEAVGVEC